MHFGFNSAVRGLLASQRALYTTNHNIDNANTRGYSRQKVQQKATNPFHMPGMGFMGTGTTITDINRIRDSFVDFKYWSETAPLGEWNQKKDILMEIERLMGEPTNNSFRQYMDDFYSSLETMSTNPSDISFREPVVQNAMAFTKHLNETAKRLEDMVKETEYTIDSKIRQINSLSSQIVRLNKQIYSAEIDGKSANDLRDRRELLVDDLSRIVPVRVKESAEGKYTVSVGGISIVDHLHINEMAVTIDRDAELKDKYKLTWESGGSVNLQAGELKGLLDMVGGDGTKNSYRGIPYFQKQLDDFAKGYAEKFNDQHKKGYGYGKDENGDERTGLAFFVGKDGSDDKDNITAATITISKKILDDIKNIAAASGEGGFAEDTNNLLELIDQRNDKNFFGGDPLNNISQGTPDDFIKSMLSSMAVDSLQASRIYKTQELIQKNIETKRNSISGVSLEEEMADMVRFQHVYVASSKMISTMDFILDLTVNRLGNVGR